MLRRLLGILVSVSLRSFRLDNMAGRIRSSDVDEVKSRTNIVDVVSEHVALKSAGVDSLKGLCPFHDERSPSFHVRPSLGYYHCFGCAESGDAISFVQRMDHLSFSETVERLAQRIGYVLTYEEGGKPREGENRARLLAANAAAAEFFQAQLESSEAETGRTFLTDRKFDAAAAQQFGIGYAPKGWDALSKHLTGLGFSNAELIAAGLVSKGERGTYDRFRGRLVWPIRDTSAQTIGFGARKLYDDDQGPKYLNTPETPVYHKSNVLYGLDLAKRSISRGKQVVVVEGYTDVMACHLAGITTAVATCGTAFGKDHISVLRRVMGDDSAGGEVIFTFDPDEAGQKAALRAFSDEKRFTAQTFVAEAPEGLDPCDLRLHRGDEAVRAIFERKVPLFEFALRQVVARFNPNTVEGRVSALRVAAPIVAEIKDPGLRPGYARELARMLGVDMSEVNQAIRAATSGLSSKRPSERPSERETSATPSDGQLEPHRRANLQSLPNDPSTWLERDALMAMLQHPDAIDEDIFAQASTALVSEPSLAVVRDAIASNLPAEASSDWVERVVQSAPQPFSELTRELAIAPLPQNNPEMVKIYARDIVTSLLERDLLSLKSELLRRLQRLGEDSDEESRRIQEQLMSLEQARRSLRSE